MGGRVCLAASGPATRTEARDQRRCQTGESVPADRAPGSLPTCRYRCQQGRVVPLPRRGWRAHLHTGNGQAAGPPAAQPPRVVGRRPRSSPLTRSCSKGAGTQCAPVAAQRDACAGAATCYQRVCLTSARGISRWPRVPLSIQERRHSIDRPHSVVSRRDGRSRGRTAAVSSELGGGWGHRFGGCSPLPPPCPQQGCPSPAD